MDILFDLSQESSKFAEIYHSLESDMILPNKNSVINNLEKECKFLDENPIIDFIIAHRARRKKHMEEQKQINTNAIKGENAKQMKNFSTSLRKMGLARKKLDSIVGLINSEQSQYLRFLKGLETREYPDSDIGNPKNIEKARNLVKSKLTFLMTEIESCYKIIQEEYNFLYRDYHSLLVHIKAIETFLEKQDKSITYLREEIVLLEKRENVIPKKEPKKLKRRVSC